MCFPTPLRVLLCWMCLRIGLTSRWSQDFVRHWTGKVRFRP